MAEAAAAAAAARAAPVHEEDDADECPVLVEVQDTPAAAPPLEGTRPKVPVSCWWWQHARRITMDIPPTHLALRACI
jgi:hypothetical protein